MRKLTVALVAMTLTSAAIAGPLDVKRVSGDAKWLVHLDVAGMIASDVGEYVLAEAKKRDEFKVRMLAFKKVAGFDPLKDVRGVTLYGKQFGDKSGVVVVDGTARQQDLLDLVKANKAYEKLEYGKHTLHKWQGKGPHGKERPAVGCFYNKDTVVIASSRELIQNAIDVLDGKASSLAQTKAIKALPPWVPGSLMIAAANDIKLPPEAHRRSLILNSITAGSIQVSEAADKMAMSISLTARTPEHAASIRQIAQGLIAFGHILKQREDLAVFRDLGEEIVVGGTGSAARLEASIPTDSLIKVVKHVAAKAKARCGRRGPFRHGQGGWRGKAREKTRPEQPKEGRKKEAEPEPASGTNSG